MAAVAIVVVELSTGDLLRVETEFGVRLTALDIASGEREERQDGDYHRNTEAQGKAIAKAIAQVRGQIAEVESQDVGLLWSAG